MYDLSAETPLPFSDSRCDVGSLSRVRVNAIELHQHETRSHATPCRASCSASTAVCAQLVCSDRMRGSSMTKLHGFVRWSSCVKRILSMPVRTPPVEPGSKNTYVWPQSAASARLWIVAAPISANDT